MSPAEESVVRTSARNGWLLSAPALVVLALAATGPLLIVVWYSFLTANDTGGVIREFSTDGWVALLFTYDIFDDQWVLADAHLTIFWRSVWLSLATTALTFVIGFPTAWFIATRPPKARALWLFLITIPFWTSYIIRVSLWFVILGYDGMLDKALMSLGIMNTQLNFASYGIPAIIFVLAHAYAPFAVLPIFVSLEKVDRSLLEAGQDLGESRWRTFLRVTLPLSMPGVIAAALIVFIPTVGDYVTPKLVGDGKEPMIANFIETQLLRLQNMPQGSAFAVASMLMVGIVSVVFVLLNRRFIGGRK